MIEQELLRKLWNGRQTVEGLEPDEFRLDPCNALIEWSKYGDPLDDNGWVIDNIVPRAMLKGAPEEEIDDPVNLRPMHYKNNASKGDDFPIYSTKVKYVEGKNEMIDDWYEVNEELKQTLIEKYSKYFEGNDIES